MNLSLMIIINFALFLSHLAMCLVNARAINHNSYLNLYWCIYVSFVVFYGAWVAQANEIAFEWLVWQGREGERKQLLSN